MTTTTSADPNINSQAGPSTQPQPYLNQQQHPHPNHTNIDPNLDPSLHPHPHPHPPHSHPHSMGAGSNIDPALASTSTEFGPHDSHVGASDDGQGLTFSSATGPNTNGTTVTGNNNNNGGGGTVITVSGVGNVVSVSGTSLAGPSGTPLIPGLGLTNAGNNSGPGPNAISAAKAKVRAEEAAGLGMSQRTRSPTPPRALFRSTTGKGVAFTDEDVVFLIKLLEWRRVQGKSDMVTFWKEIAQKVCCGVFFLPLLFSTPSSSSSFSCFLFFSFLSSPSCIQRRIHSGCTVVLTVTHLNCFWHRIAGATSFESFVDEVL